MSIERKKLVKKLDMVFSEFIRERDGYRCVTCGVTSNTHTIQAGHLFSRVSYSTRWDEENCLCQCSGCNMKHEYNFEPLRRAWRRKYRETESLKKCDERYDRLYAKFCQTTKFSDSDLKQMIEIYKQKISNLKLSNNN